jgi:hypothetical protein
MWRGKQAGDNGFAAMVASPLRASALRKPPDYERRRRGRLVSSPSTSSGNGWASHQAGCGLGANDGGARRVRREVLNLRGGVAGPPSPCQPRRKRASRSWVCRRRACGRAKVPARELDEVLDGVLTRTLQPTRPSGCRVCIPLW